MSNYFNATCAICGKKYHICNSCKNAQSFVPWRTITDSSSCYKIFLILSNYTNGHISDQEAKEQLQHCNLSQLDTFETNIKVTIETLLSESNDR